MAGLGVPTIMVCIEINETPMEIMGQANVVEVFVTGMEESAFHITIEKPSIMKNGSSFGEMAKEDLPKEEVPILEGSPMLLDKGKHLKQRMTKVREDEDEDDGPLSFKHLKRARTWDTVESSKGKERLEEEVS